MWWHRRICKALPKNIEDGSAEEMEIQKLGGTASTPVPSLAESPKQPGAASAGEIQKSGGPASALAPSIPESPKQPSATLPDEVKVFHVVWHYTTSQPADKGKGIACDEPSMVAAPDQQALPKNIRDAVPEETEIQKLGGTASTPVPSLAESPKQPIVAPGGEIQESTGPTLLPATSIPEPPNQPGATTPHEVTAPVVAGSKRQLPAEEENMVSTYKRAVASAKRKLHFGDSDKKEA